MATGLQRLVRRAVLSTLKADAPLTAIVPAARIYGQSTPSAPVWPFIKLGGPQTLPRRAAGMPFSGVVTFDVHAFAKPRLSGTAIAETAEDYAGRIGAAIESVLDSARLALEGGGYAGLRLSEMRLLQDADEADAYHYFCQVTATCAA